MWRYSRGLKPQNHRKDVVDGCTCTSIRFVADVREKEEKNDNNNSQSYNHIWKCVPPGYSRHFSYLWGEVSTRREKGVVIF